MLCSQENGGRFEQELSQLVLQLQHQMQRLRASLWALPALWSIPGNGREVLPHPKLPPVQQSCL